MLYLSNANAHCCHLPPLLSNAFLLLLPHHRLTVVHCCCCLHPHRHRRQALPSSVITLPMLLQTPTGRCHHLRSSSLFTAADIPVVHCHCCCHCPLHCTYPPPSLPNAMFVTVILPTPCHCPSPVPSNAIVSHSTATTVAAVHHHHQMATPTVVHCRCRLSCCR
jgi:hypothetical protein